MHILKKKQLLCYRYLRNTIHTSNINLKWNQKWQNSAYYFCSESVPVFFFFPCSETVQSRWSDATHVYLAWMCDRVLVLGIKSRGQGLGRDAYKARSLTPPSPEKQRVCREAVALNFCSFLSTKLCLVALDKRPRLNSQTPWTPPKWVWVAPLLCWPREAMPKVSGGLLYHNEEGGSSVVVVVVAMQQKFTF